MAGGIDLGPRNRKSLDAVINMVPFIDLMAVTIAFLIMTSVWTQVGRMQVGSSGGQSTESPASPPLALLVSKTQLELTFGAERRVFGDLGGLAAVLPSLAAESVNIHAEDDVPYDTLVHVIDACLAAKITGVTVTP
jgi:biopolymer transport protein ExbD